MSDPALQEPAPANEPEAQPLPALTMADALPNTTASDDRSALDSQFNATVRMLAASPTVMVRVPEGGLYAQINGWKNFYPEGRYEVPQPIADLWVEAKRI